MKDLRANQSLAYLGILLLLFTITSIRPVAAQDARSDLIAQINGLRASYGLPPYSIDPGLMAMAQEHSQYQASIHQSTHLHSDGRTPPQLGVKENVAGGTVGYVTPYIVVYNIWVDPGHLYTMVGYSSGMMGVGVADDGINTYYTLEVIPTGPAVSSPPVPGSTPGAGATPVVATRIPEVKLVTATPRPDGSIVHVVGYGQTLWSIALAYGVKIDQLRAWNNISEGSSEIYAGQRLLVRPAGLYTATPSPEAGTLTIDSLWTPTPQGSSITSTMTPSLTRNLADINSSKAGNQAATQPPSSPSPAGSGTLLPIIGGASLLVGIALLALLFRSRKPK